MQLSRCALIKNYGLYNRKEIYRKFKKGLKRNSMCHMLCVHFEYSSKITTYDIYLGKGPLAMIQVCKQSRPKHIKINSLTSYYPSTKTHTHIFDNFT